MEQGRLGSSSARREGWAGAVRDDGNTGGLPAAVVRVAGLRLHEILADFDRSAMRVSVPSGSTCTGAVASVRAAPSRAGYSALSAIARTPVRAAPAPATQLL